MEQFSLRWKDYLKQMTNAFDSLRNEEDLVDVTLSCEGRKLKAHKMLLSACSPYFRDIFKDNPCQHPVIVFRNMKYADLEAIVDYIYRGKARVMEDHLGSFLDTAELLQIKGLSQNNPADISMMENADTPPSTTHESIIQPTINNTPENQALEKMTSSTDSTRRISSIDSASSTLVMKKEEPEEHVEREDEDVSLVETPDNNMQDSTTSEVQDTLDSSDSDPKHATRLPNRKSSLIKAALTNKPQKGASTLRKPLKSPKLRSPLIPVTAKGKLTKKVLRSVTHKGKQPFRRPIINSERVTIPPGLTVTASSASVDQDMPITRSEDAKTPVGEELYQNQGIPLEQEQVVGDQFQPVTGEEAPLMDSEAVADIPVVEEEVKEPEFDYYGCETCKAEAKPCDRLAFHHKCPICPCLCFCSHLLKEHMKIIHGWFNVQRKFTHNF